MLKRTVALAAILSTISCGSDKRASAPPIPVDGMYRYALERTRNTCSDQLAMEEGRAGYLDVLARLDGTFDLRHGNAYLPLPFKVEGVELAGSEVDHADTWTGGGGTEYAYSVRGTISPTALDVEIWFRGVDRCEMEIRMTGTPFPVADPNDVEGYYAMHVSSLGDPCDANATEVEWNGVSTFWATLDDDIRAALFEPVTVTLGPRGLPDVDWQGTIAYPMGFFSLDLEATLTGTYGPSAVDLAYDQWAPGDGPATTECRSQYQLNGAKRLPSLTAVDNDYRVHYAATDDCTEDPTERTWAANEGAQLITQPDGSVWLRDRYSDILLTEDASGAFTGTQGSVAEGYTLERTVRVSPPDLSATYLFTKYAADGTADCTIRLDAQGLPRYVFE